jgi:hypothetical protein
MASLKALHDCAKKTQPLNNNQASCRKHLQNVIRWQVTYGADFSFPEAYLCTAFTCAHVHRSTMLKPPRHGIGEAYDTYIVQLLVRVGNVGSC